MNTSQKCENCAHEEVCAHKQLYNDEKERIDDMAKASPVIRVHIECKHFWVKPQNIRGA